MPGIRRKNKTIKVKAGKWVLVDEVYIAAGPKKIPIKTTFGIRIRHTTVAPPFIRELTFKPGDHVFVLTVHYNKVEVYADGDAVITWKE